MKNLYLFILLCFTSLCFSNNDSIPLSKKGKITKIVKKSKFSKSDSKIVLDEVFNSNNNVASIQPFFNNPNQVVEQSFVKDYFKLDGVVTEGGVLEKVKALFNSKVQYVDKIIGTELIQLPIGLQGATSDGNNSAKLVIVKAKVTPQYIELMAFAELKTPSMAVYFAAENLKLSNDGGVIGEWKLQLLANCSIPQIGNKFLLSITGGSLDKETGEIKQAPNTTQQTSYIEFDCNGFKNFQFNVDIRLARSLAVPIGSDGTVIPYGRDLADDKVLAVGNDKYVGAKIYASGTGWQDLLLKLNLPKFESPKLKGWQIEIKDLVLDLSDTRNEETFLLPKVYVDNPSFFPNGDIKTWRGVYAKSIEVTMPVQFGNSQTGKKTTISALNMLIDNKGVTGTFVALTPLESGKANGWHFFIDYVGLELELGSFKGAKFIGGVKPSALDSYLKILGSYNNGQYLFKAEVTKANMSLFKGKLMFQKGSYVQMQYTEGSNQFKASAMLSGNLNIKGNPGTAPTAAATTTAAATPPVAPPTSPANPVLVTSVVTPATATTPATTTAGNPNTILSAGEVTGIEKLKGTIDKKITKINNWLYNTVDWIPNFAKKMLPEKTTLQLFVNSTFEKSIIDIDRFILNEVNNNMEKYNPDYVQPEATSSNTTPTPDPLIGTSSTHLASQNNEKALFQANSIVFQNLKLNSYQKPYIEADYFGFTGSTGELGNFPISFENIFLYTPTPGGDEVGLGVTVKVNLMDYAGISGSSTLKIIGKFSDGDYHNFKFERLLCTGISVDVVKSGFELKGFVNSFSNDPLYGTGFEGGLEVKFPDLDISGGVRALFCNKEERFWYVDFDITNNSTSPSKFKILKVVGGLSYKMKRDATANAFGTANVAYKYDANAGMSYRAGVSAKFGSTKSFAAKVYLEIDYTASGGLSRIYFLGEGAMMGDNQEVGEDKTSLIQVVGKKEKLNESQQFAADYKAFTQSGNFLEAAKTIHPRSDIARGGKFGLYVSIEKKFRTSTQAPSFDGLFEIYCNTEGFKGAGQDGLLGMVHLYSSETKNFVHIGTPTRRLGAIFPAGPYLMNVSAYFMTGDQLEPQVISNDRIRTIFPNINDQGRMPSILSEGKGFAFGLDFRVSIGKDFGWFYAFLEAGAGFDIMHRQFQGVSCKGRPGPVGNDGWYSMGNVYAYLWGEAGLRVKVFGFKKQIKLVELGVGAVLKGEFPNPTHMEGRIGIYYNVLGGMIKGTFNYKAEIGEKCEMIGMSNPLSIPIIASVSPENEQDVDVFKKPQAAFNYKMMTPFQAEDNQGNPKTIRVFLKKFELKEGSNDVVGEVQWTENNGKVNFVPSETLPPQKDINCTVEVGIQELVNGNWNAYNGDPNANETKTFTFKTGNAPEYIPMTNIKYTYPVVDMNNFYPSEHKNVYVKLKQGQGYLFNGSVVNWTLKGEFHENNVLKYSNNLSYDSTKKLVNFTYDGLETNKNYRLRFMAYPPGNAPTAVGATIDLDQVVSEVAATNNIATASTDTQTITSNQASAQNNVAANKEFLTYTFKASQHNTFTDKMNSIQTTNTLIESINNDAQVLSLNTNVNEMFDKTELIGTLYSDNKPLVTSEAILDDTYFTGYIKPLIYTELPLDETINITNRNVNLLGLPPTKNIDIPASYRFLLENNSTTLDFKTRFPFRYNSVDIYLKDYIDLKSKLINKYVNPPMSYAKAIQYANLLQNMFLPIQIGTYKIKVNYKLWDNLHQNEATVIYNRN